MDLKIPNFERSLKDSESPLKFSPIKLTLSFSPQELAEITNKFVTDQKLLPALSDGFTWLALFTFENGQGVLHLTADGGR